MFYNQLPDSQKHHLALKPAIDAVKLAGWLEGSQYGPGECAVAISEIGTLTDARIAAHAVALGQQYSPDQGSVIELEVDHTIHGLTMPVTKDGGKLTNRDGAVLAEFEPSFVIITLVTSATERVHVQSVISSAQRRLDDLAEDLYDSVLPSASVIWLTITPGEMLEN